MTKDLVSARSKARALALGVAAAGLVAVSLTAASGGAAARPDAQTRARGLEEVLAQVQARFGDDRISSASVSGSTLSVDLTAPDGPSFVDGTFEAQVLAHAVADWMHANGQESVTSLVYRQSGGGPLAGTPLDGDTVGSEPQVAPLENEACESAASTAASESRSLTTVSAQMLSFLGGTCVFRFETSDPPGFAAAAPTVVGTLVSAIGDPNERPYLVQVDDSTGTPEFVFAWMPGEGGTTWIHPGLSSPFVNGFGS